MRWLRHALSLRAKITATFTLIVVGGTVVSTLIGSWIITNALLNQARLRGRQGLEAARTIYADRLAQVGAQLQQAAQTDALATGLQAGDLEFLAAAVTRARDAASLDFLSVVDARSLRVVRATGGAGPSAVPPALAAPVRVALDGQVVTSTELFDRATLRAESEAAAELAIVRPEPDAADPAAAPVTDGLVMFAAVPILVEGRIVGAIYGGTLLNNRHEIVDRIEQLLYGRETYKDRKVGTAAIMLGRTWVSTNVMQPAGPRAIGTRLSPDVARYVLEDGQSWSGRAQAVGSWYVASCEPIRDRSRNVVGALYVAILEAPILAARTEVMLTFLVVCLAGLIVVFALTYLLTRTTIHPLEEMVAATKRIAGGDLDATVKVSSRDEVGDLAASFNNMLASLKTMNNELQLWAHTLEEKVRDRTDELVSVQSRMAQSEKLASIGRLAAGVAHGLNNPLGGILSLTMLALEELPADHPMRADLDLIIKQTLRCREIVKGLLDFSRQSETRVDETDVNAVITSTLALLERQAIFHNIRTERTLEENLPPVLIDPGQLQEVLINLILNAVDAMEENGDLTIETRTHRAAGEVLIRIGDNGKGIPPDILPFIFEPFFTTKKVGKGTGLGLAIVHGVVTRAGGRVEVTSHPEATTFTIRLPIAKEETVQ